MFNLLKQKIHRGVLSTLGSLALFSCIDVPKASHTFLLSQIMGSTTHISRFSNWKRFHSVQGACSISLPSTPEHLKQTMPLSDEGYNLRYDIYVAPHERKAVYMLLIAQYPPLINGSHAEINLENFLNGLITQNPENTLIFADLTEVQGYKALDFFIQVRGTYFKGRAIMANNNLYLLSMECDKKNYADRYFKYFIKSFKIKK